MCCLHLRKTSWNIGHFVDDCGKLLSQAGPQRHCVQERAMLQLYTAAKSHKMSLTTPLHSNQSVSYFSLLSPVSHFLSLGSQSSLWLEKPLLFFFPSSAQLISSRQVSEMVLAEVSFSAADVEAGFRNLHSEKQFQGCYSGDSAI